MTHPEVIEMIKGMDLPFAYDHFAEGESPDPPFICFLYPGSDNFGADNKVWFRRWTLAVEVYTDYKDPKLEIQVESVLESHDIFWEKTETWIPSEKMYEVRYEIELDEGISDQ